MTETEFLSLQPLAVFGVSSVGRGFGAAAYKELQKAGIKAYPINPKGGALDGQKIYSDMGELPEAARAGVILTRGLNAIRAVEECALHHLKCVWLQGGSDTPQVRRRCEELRLKMLHGQCILLRPGRFPHSLHRFFHDLLGGKPPKTS